LWQAIAHSDLGSILVDVNFFQKSGKLAEHGLIGVNRDLSNLPGNRKFPAGRAVTCLRGIVLKAIRLTVPARDVRQDARAGLAPRVGLPRRPPRSPRDLYAGDARS
jgi:hypothetical protein